MELFSSSPQHRLVDLVTEPVTRRHGQCSVRTHARHAREEVRVIVREQLLDHHVLVGKHGGQVDGGKEARARAERPRHGDNAGRGRELRDAVALRNAAALDQ